MGKRGPRPTPTPILKARGSWRAKKRAGETPAAPGAPTAPAWLEDEARETWERLVDELLPLGVVTALDQTALAILCQAVLDYVGARKIVREEGITLVSVKGAIYQHPVVGIANRAWERVLRACKEFGLTPAARAGLKIEKPETKDDGKARFFKTVG